MCRPPRAEPETARQKIGLEDRLEHDLHRGRHDTVTDRGNRQRSLFARPRFGDEYPPRGQRPPPIGPQVLGQLIEELRATKHEALNLRFRNATGQLDNTAEIGRVRRQIARINTLIRQREIAAAEAAQ